MVRMLSVTLKKLFLKVTYFNGQYNATNDVVRDQKKVACYAV